jgi:hypothetical protein
MTAATAIRGRFARPIPFIDRRPAAVLHFGLIGIIEAESEDDIFKA